MKTKVRIECLDCDTHTTFKSVFAVVVVLLVVSLYSLISMFGDRSEISRRAYNRGYVQGQSYAYDNVVVCGASPEIEGLFIAQILNESESTISCQE